MEDYSNTMTEPPMPTPEKTSGLAIASLVLGILALVTCGCTGLVGLILGVLALCGIGSSEGRIGGRGMAVAGIIVSAIGMILGMVLCSAALIFPAFTRARSQAEKIVIMNNGRQLALSMLMYADDNAKQLPDPNSWVDRVAVYGGGQAAMTSPLEPDLGRIWAMNGALKAVKTDDIKQPHRVVLLFECRSGSPLYGGPELLSESPRSHRGYAVVFVDGHVERVDQMRIGDLIWEPETTDQTF